MDRLLLTVGNFSFHKRQSHSNSLEESIQAQVADQRVVDINHLHWKNRFLPCGGKWGQHNPNENKHENPDKPLHSLKNWLFFIF